MKDNINVYIETCRENVELPCYANIGDVGMDVRAAEDVIIGKNETKIIPTGLKVAIPEGYEIQVRARSGVSLKTPLRISNGIGTIDEGYRDEIGIIITNTSDFECHWGEYYTVEDKGNKQGAYIIRKGDRIAQFVLSKVPKINWIPTENVKEIGIDRLGGFGSSGTV